METQFYKNTLTNYISKIVKILSAFFTTRALVTTMHEDNYGLWSLLWMIFGYSLLFDFGLGMAAQKSAAFFKSDNNILKLNRTISTTFFTYTIFAILILLWTLISANYLDSFINTDLDSIEKFKGHYLEFGILSALIFPTGFFRELLVGINRIDLRNYVLLTYELLNFLIILLICYSELPFLYLIRASLSLILLSNIAIYFIFHLKTGCRISIKYFKLSTITSNISFNICAYIIMCSNLIILKTDQIILSSLGSLSLVAGYQIASRVPHLMKILTDQFQENLIPMTIKLKNLKDTNSLKKVYSVSTRYNLLLATCFTVGLMISSKSILKIWLKIDDLIIAETTNIIILSTYVTTIVKGVNSNMLLMLNKHSFLAKVNTAEALGNLILTIILVKTIGLKGAAIGTLIPQIILALIFVIPKGSRHFSVTQYSNFYKPLIMSILVASIPGLLLNLSLNVLKPTALINILFILIQYGILYLIISYFVLITRDEKKLINKAIMKKIRLLKK